MDVNQLVEPATGVPLATLAGLIAAAVYSVWRRFKADRRYDRTAEREDSFRDDLIALNRELQKRCDAFAHERNELIIKLGAAQAEIERLKDRLSRFEGEVA